MYWIKCICIVPYGLKKDGKFPYNIGDVVEIKINDSGRITNFKDKTGKNFIFMSSKETFYKCFNPLAEWRENQIDSVLDD
jgi:hypothetical protein